MDRLTPRPGERITARLPVIDSDGNHTGDIDETAYLTVTPGLAVQLRDGPDPDDPDDVGELWRVFHLRSGGSICWADDPETAQRIAGALAERGDWTVSAAELLERHGVAAPDVGAIVYSLGGYWSNAPRMAATSLLTR